MKIEISNIVDQNIISDNETFKLMLADGVLSLFTPLFYEEIRKKQEQLKRNILDIKKLKKNVIDSSEKSKKLKFLINKEKIKNEVLSEVNYLSEIDVIYGSNRELIKDILTSLDVQKEVDLKRNLKVLQKIIKSKINKKDK